MNLETNDKRRPVSMDPCNLCPRVCGARRAAGEAGFCGANDRMFVARAALHFWEEPVLSGEAGSGAVFFAHCPLRCAYCQNAVIANGRAGVETEVERLTRICLELQAQGAMNVNFVTPTHYSLQIADAVERARQDGLRLPIVWNTSGYERLQTLRALEGAVDVYLADFKYASADLARRYSHAPDYPEVAMAALGEMARQVGSPRFDDFGGCARMTRGVVVRHLVLPGCADESKRALALLWGTLGDSVLYSIMNQYTPVLQGEACARFPELGRRVTDAEYEEILDFADSLGMEDYFWQEGPAAEESFIPDWDGTGVAEIATGG